jgi:hypothetical protein
MLALLSAARLQLLRLVLSQSKPPGPLKFPTLLPPWEVEWSLNRSTIVQPCSESSSSQRA